jgi:hypothetical protein
VSDDTGAAATKAMGKGSEWRIYSDPSHHASGALLSSVSSASVTYARQ